MDGPSLAREYYRSIDEDDYEALAELLAADFVQHRPDRTLSGRDRFVRFMREERPVTDTEHVLEAVYLTERSDRETIGEGRTRAAEAGEVVEEQPSREEVARVAAEGRLLRADGSTWFGFVDTFALEDGRIRSLTTYTNGR